MSQTLNIYFTNALQIQAIPKSEPVYTIITTTTKGLTSTVRANRMAYNLADAMQINVKVAYVDADQNPAVVDGPVRWSSSNDAVATVEATATDGSTALIKAVALGTAQVTATADADMGSGIRELLTPFDVTVVAGEAVAGVISPVGDPEPIAR